jgi:uncharacterized membrane protein
MTSRLQHPHFVIFVAVLSAATAVLGVFTELELAFMLAFDAAAVVYVVITLRWAKDAAPDAIRERAARNDAGRSLLLLLAAVVAAVVLVAVGFATRHASGSPGFLLSAAIVTLVLAWLFANVVYALHYAHMFYDELSGADRGGLVFPGTQTPDYLDFCYFAAVIGATFQVSDVQVTSRAIRRVVLVQSLMAFAFNVGVLALTVNVVAAVI